MARGSQFTFPPRYADEPTAAFITHMFDMRCRENGIEHRLTKIKHPWTDGQFNLATADNQQESRKTWENFLLHCLLHLDLHAPWPSHRYRCGFGPSDFGSPHVTAPCRVAASSSEHRGGDTKVRIGDTSSRNQPAGSVFRYRPAGQMHTAFGQ